MRSLVILGLVIVAMSDVAAADPGTPLVRTAERLASGVVTAVSPEEQAARRMETVLTRALGGTATSMFVADAETGERVFAVEPDAPLNPASNVKLIATATALDLEGPDFRYWTGVLADAPSDLGHVRGDLYLLGTYDPTLDKTSLDGLAQQLVASGMSRLEGDVVVGDSKTRDGIFQSFVTLTIEAGAPGQAPRVTVSPPNDLVEVDVRVTTARTRRPKHKLVVARETRIDDAGRARVRVTLTGQVGRGRQSRRTVWVQERALLAAHLLRQSLRDAGVEVCGDVHVATMSRYLGESIERGLVPVPLAEHHSRPLAEIVQRVNKQSTNWLADRIIMTTAARRFGGKPSMEVAIRAMHGWLARRTGIGRDELVIDTGSGLSYRTAISTRQLVKILRAGAGLGDRDPDHLARRGPRWDAYRRSLAIGGRDGTLKYRFRDLDGTVLGKTGTLSNVVALSGILRIDPGRRLVFSIVTNGHAPRRKAAVRRAQGELVTVLADYLHRRSGANVE